MDDATRVLGIAGSPRRDGNTDVLVQTILAAASEEGARTEFIRLGERAIEPCRACNACHETGGCVIDDDMASVIEQMELAHAWVLGTPVYWWGPTAQFKAFLDRWYAFDQKRAFFRNRRVVFAIPSGGGPSYARHTVGILEDVAAYLGMDHRGTLLAGGSGGKGAIRDRSDLMRQARNLGQDISR